MDKKRKKKAKTRKKRRGEKPAVAAARRDRCAGGGEKSARREFQIGDSIVVKEGARVPDRENLDIQGWQGKIREIDDEEPPVLSIAWDSITLKNMPRLFIEESEEAGLLWMELYLYAEDALPARPRDREEDAAKAVEEIRELYVLDRFSEEIDAFDPLDAPTYDYLASRNLDDDKDLDEIVEFLSDSIGDYFLKWDAVLRDERGRPLKPIHEKLLSELINYGGEDDDPILYINDMARPAEPWYETIRKIAAALVMEKFDTSDVHYATATEGWQEIVDCLEEYGKDLTLPEGVENPVDIVPRYIQHRLMLQSCLGELGGLGQKYTPGGEALISLEGADAEARIESFMDALRDHGESLAYLDLTLEKFYDFLILPPGDQEILTRVMLRELGMSSPKNLIADFL
ncbi:MAG: hypothetical protein GY859_01945 [Desulfobacterales bacterium]|nr:hypothetical protein [Desulfobacterales bacterium]